MNVTCMLYVVILNLEPAKVIWGHSVHYSVNWPVTKKKTAYRRTKGTKIWASGVYVTCMFFFFFIFFFYLEHVTVMLDHLEHFSENWAVTQKRLIVERNGQTFGPWGVYNMHVGIFYLEHAKVIWGHSVHFFRLVERNGRTGCIYMKL